MGRKFTQDQEQVVKVAVEKYNAADSTMTVKEVQEAINQDPLFEGAPISIATVGKFCRAGKGVPSGKNNKSSKVHEGGMVTFSGFLAKLRDAVEYGEKLEERFKQVQSFLG